MPVYKSPMFDLLLIDPPWPHYGSPTKMAAAGKHYDLMSMEEIRALPIKKILNPSALVLCWATCPRLDLAIDAIKAWGLHFRGVPWIWVKTNQEGRMIHNQGVPPTLTKPSSEMLLAATTKPTGRPFKVHHQDSRQIVLAPRGAHSAKPEVFYEHIERLCPNTSKVELFATKPRDGWTSLGRGIDGLDIREAISILMEHEKAPSSR